MGSSSRAARPESLYTTSAPSYAAAPVSAYGSTPGSAGSGSMSSEKAPISPSSYTRRTDSTGSTATTDSYQSTSACEMSRKVSTGSVNANSYCGRHSDQFLFGGWGNIVKGVFHPKKN